MEPICCEERRPRKKLCCGDIVLGVLFFLLAITLGLIIGAVVATTLLANIAALIVLAVVLAILIVIRGIMLVCNKKMQC